MNTQEDPKSFVSRMMGPGDEDKEPCVQCGTVWYTIHHKDGLCRECQSKGLPGRSVIVKQERNFERVLNVVEAFLVFLEFLVVIALLILAFTIKW